MKCNYVKIKSLIIKNKFGNKQSKQTHVFFRNVCFFITVYNNIAQLVKEQSELTNTINNC